MSKIKIFSLGGLNENGKNMYVVTVDKNIYIFDAGLKYDNEKTFEIDRAARERNKRVRHAAFIGIYRYNRCNNQLENRLLQRIKPFVAP